MNTVGEKFYSKREGDSRYSARDGKPVGRGCLTMRRGGGVRARSS